MLPLHRYRLTARARCPVDRTARLHSPHRLFDFVHEAGICVVTVDLEHVYTSAEERQRSIAEVPPKQVRVCLLVQELTIAAPWAEARRVVWHAWQSESLINVPPAPNGLYGNTENLGIIAICQASVRQFECQLDRAARKEVSGSHD
jgi:hypothetical protein